MKDPRVAKLAKVMINYSLKVKKGQYMMLTGAPVSQPLLLECYRAAMKAGANVETAITLPGADEIFYNESTLAQRQWVSGTTKHRTRKLDASCLILGSDNTRSLTNCDPKRMSEVAKARQPMRKIWMKRAGDGDLNWTLTQWPTQASAQDAEMSLAEYEDFVFTAGHLDDDDPVATWKKIKAVQQKLANRLNRATEFHIVAKNTDLTFSTKGRKWLNSAGKCNFPDGEIFTSPVEKSANGHIQFSFPAIHQSREVLDACLEFKDGKVVSATASKGEDFLRTMVDMDAGSCYLGEAAFGTNYNIKRFTRNTLFD
ncbi:MAG: aminopeptidase, partial [Phycisphaerales bacterium]|nr:aminopeptidase [Phycisphaerales bacterium]